MINHLRTLYALETTKTYYISGAPQCVVPDAHLADAIEKSWFDFLFVQFYNTPSCSARAYFGNNYGGSGSNISFDEWASFVRSSSQNSQAKLYLGLPASTIAANAASMYLSPSEASELVSAYQCKYPDLFGGIMIWEATYSENNQIDGKSYADNMKEGFVSSHFFDVHIRIQLEHPINDQHGTDNEHGIDDQHDIDNQRGIDNQHDIDNQRDIDNQHGIDNQHWLLDQHFIQQHCIFNQYCILNQRRVFKQH
ncbi:MAG: hypothetical protein M1830_003040 [Pleopsidium flavum]|nr:MAG: hypothetical protein M1830_003040 [Pleopsidium flavum]